MPQRFVVKLIDLVQIWSSDTPHGVISVNDHWSGCLLRDAGGCSARAMGSWNSCNVESALAAGVIEPKAAYVSALLMVRTARIYFLRAAAAQEAPAKQPAHFTAHFCIGRSAAGPSRSRASAPRGTRGTRESSISGSRGSGIFQTISRRGGQLQEAWVFRCAIGR